MARARVFVTRTPEQEAARTAWLDQFTKRCALQRQIDEEKGTVRRSGRGGASSVPVSSMCSESVIEDYLKRRVKEAGGDTRKVQWIGRNFAPDRLVMLPNRPRTTVWVELKAPGEAPSLGQLEEHDRMRALGQTVVVIDSHAGVDDLVNDRD